MNVHDIGSKYFEIIKYIMHKCEVLPVNKQPRTDYTL